MSSFFHRGWRHDENRSHSANVRAVSWEIAYMPMLIALSGAYCCRSRRPAVSTSWLDTFTAECRYSLLYVGTKSQTANNGKNNWHVVNRQVFCFRKINTKIYEECYLRISSCFMCLIMRLLLPYLKSTDHRMMCEC